MVAVVKRLWAALALALVAGCATAPGPTPQGAAAAAGTPGRAGAGSTATGASRTTPAATDTAALQSYLDQGLDKLDRGAVAEGIQNLVTLLAEVGRVSAPTDEQKQFAAAAVEELNRVGASLNLAPSIEWVGADKNQIAASTLDVGTPRALNPSVTLTFTLGSTRTVVAGAPVVFEFVKGGGSLVTPVTTNEFGQANTTVGSLGSTSAENVVRATVRFRDREFEYVFREVSRDFAYVPPVRKATILALERATDSEGKIQLSGNPVSLDRVFNVLKGIDFSFAPYNGRLLGEQFTRVFGGDREAIRALGLEDGVSYLVLVLNDIPYVRQVELNGRKYDMYTSRGSGTARILRVADGKALYSTTVDSVQGQGNVPDRAITDGHGKIADKLAEKLSAEIEQIRRAMLGS